MDWRAGEELSRLLERSVLTQPMAEVTNPNLDEIQEQEMGSPSSTSSGVPSLHEWVDVAKSDIMYDEVIFMDVPKIYPGQKDMAVNFAFTPDLTAQRYACADDSVCLFKISFKELSECIVKKCVQMDTEETKNGTVTFPAAELPTDDSEFYQFLYTRMNCCILGASTPFRIIAPGGSEMMEDDFLVIRSQLQDENMHLKLSVKKLETRLIAEMQNIENVLASIKDLEKTIADKDFKLEEDMKRATVEMDLCKLSSEKADVEKEKNVMEETVKMQKSEISQLSSDLDGQMILISSRGKTILDLQKTISAKNKQLEQEREMNSSSSDVLRQALRETDDILQATTASKSLVLDELDRQTADCTMAKKEIADLKLDRVRMHIDLEMAEKEISELKLEKSQFEKTLEGAEKEISELKLEKLQFERLDGARKFLTEPGLRNSEFDKIFDKVEVEIVGLKVEKTKLFQILRKAKKEIAGFGVKLDEPKLGKALDSLELEILGLEVKSTKLIQAFHQAKKEISEIMDDPKGEMSDLKEQTTETSSASSELSQNTSNEEKEEVDDKEQPQKLTLEEQLAKRRRNDLKRVARRAMELEKKAKLATADLNTERTLKENALTENKELQLKYEDVIAELQNEKTLKENAIIENKELQQKYDDTNDTEIKLVAEIENLTVDMHELSKKAEIGKRLNAVLLQILPFLSQEHQQQMAAVIERAKQINPAELNFIIGNRLLFDTERKAVEIIQTKAVIQNEKTLKENAILENKELQQKYDDVIAELQKEKTLKENAIIENKELQQKYDDTNDAEIKLAAEIENLTVEMHELSKEAEIGKRLNAVLLQIVPFLSQEHQQQMAAVIERSKQITPAELKMIIRNRMLHDTERKAVGIIQTKAEESDVVVDLKARLLEAAEIFKEQYQEIKKLRKQLKDLQAAKLEDNCISFSPVNSTVGEKSNSNSARRNSPVYVSDDEVNTPSTPKTFMKNPIPINDSDTGEHQVDQSKTVQKMVAELREQLKKRDELPVVMGTCGNNCKLLSTELPVMPGSSCGKSGSKLFPPERPVVLGTCRNNSKLFPPELPIVVGTCSNTGHVFPPRLPAAVRALNNSGKLFSHERPVEHNYSRQEGEPLFKNIKSRPLNRFHGSSNVRVNYSDNDCQIFAPVNKTLSPMLAPVKDNVFRDRKPNTDFEYVSVICPICNEVLIVHCEDKASLADHVASAHNQSVCPVCGVFYDNDLPKEYFQYHVEGHFIHEKDSFK